MDTLTHALLGGLVVRAATAEKGWSGGIDRKTATLTASLVAAFPDIDYLSFWIDPLVFLADWHRGPTHSLLMVPVWALLLSVVLARLLHKPAAQRSLFTIATLALLSHIASDTITAYGTQVFWPVNDLRVAYATTFVIDPYFTAILVAGLIASISLARPAATARIGLLVLAGYLGSQLHWQQRAESLGTDLVAANGWDQAGVTALPQPLTPFNWLVIVNNGYRYHVTRINLVFDPNHLAWAADRLGWLGRLWSAYQPVENPSWKTRNRYGNQDDPRALIEQVWSLEPLRDFRRFAKFPVFYRADVIDGERCVWYTDLRYVLPGLTPPFRYGLCGSADLDSWELYRLRRSTQADRQSLDDGNLRRPM